MMLDAAETVFAAIDDVNEVEMHPDGRIEKSASTSLLDGDDGIDSLAFVNLIVAIEGRILDATGHSIVLVDEDTLAADTQPFATVGDLIAHVENVLRNVKSDG